MYIHHNDLAGDLGQQLVCFAEGIIVRLHKDAALKIDHGIAMSVSGNAFKNTDPRDARGIVGRAQHAASPGVAVGGVEVIHDLAFIPDVIAGGEDVAAQVEKILGNGGGKAKTAGSIFRVGNQKIDFVRFHELGRVIAKDLAPRAAEDVTHEEDLHAK